MTKTYAAPTLVVSGNAVRDTLDSTVKSGPSETPQHKPAGSGSVGFYL